MIKKLIMTGAEARQRNRRCFNKRHCAAIFFLLTCLLAAYFLGTNIGTDNKVSAQTTFPDPNANCPRAVCGEVSPFIPMQSAEAVHMGLVWKRDATTPKILF